MPYQLPFEEMNLDDSLPARAACLRAVPGTTDPLGRSRELFRPKHGYDHTQRVMMIHDREIDDKFPWKGRTEKLIFRRS